MKPLSELETVTLELEKANKIIKLFKAEKIEIKRQKEELVYREANLRKKYDEAGLNYE